MQKRPASTLDPSKIKTPAFVIEEELLRHNLEILQYVRNKTGCTVLHALKAWATPQFLHIEKEYLDGTEVSSVDEARLGYEEFGSEVHMFAPAYKPEEFSDTMNYASTIVFNSFDQWARFKPRINKFQKKTGKSIECGLRINPEIRDKDGHGELWNPCAPGSRLGIRSSEFDTALASDPHMLDGISGLHFHIFFEKDVTDLSAALTVVEKKFGAHFRHMKWINFGGGQKITDNTYDLEGLISLIKDFQKRYGVRVHLEPGAAIAWHIGTLVASVLDIVSRDDVPYKIPILDMSFEDHLTDFMVSPDLDLEIRGATIVRDENKFATHPYIYKFGGGTCIAGDRLMYGHAFDAPLKIGDKVVFEHAIQYSMVKCTMFNGVQHPDIVLWKNNKPELIRKFTYEDYRSRMG